MISLLLLAGGLLVLFVVTLAWLEPGELLRPSVRSQLIAGVVGGGVSALVLLSLRSGSDSMGVVVHPTATAFLGLYFGPLAALVSAAIALAAQLAIPQPPWGAAISVLALAALLPLVTYACLVVSGAAPLPSSVKDALTRLPWYHGAGILLLGTGRQLLAGRVHAMQALREAHEALAQREEQLRLTLDSLNGGRWEWLVQRKEFRCEGHFYNAFGIDDTSAPDLWERWFARRHPADAERTASHLARARMGLEEAYEAEFRVKNNAGQWRWIMSRGTVAERDAQGRPVRLTKGLLYWSDMCFEIHGLPAETPLPENYIVQYVAPEYQAELRQKLHDCVSHRQEQSMDLEILRADGRRLWVRARCEAVLEHGKVVRLRGVTQDIDEARRARLRLSQSEERFSRIFQLMPFPMGLSRCSDGQYVEVNPAWEKLLGIPRSEALGRTSIDLGVFTPADRENLIRAAALTSQLNGYEVTIHPRNAPPRTVLQSMRMTDFDGEPCWMFSVQDITDRKRTEEKIREREELLSLTISAASLGLWDWDLQAGTVTGNNRWRALLGNSGPAASTEPLGWTQTVSADDVDRITAEIARHAAHPATPFDATWRLQGTGSDKPRWVRNLGKIVSFDAQGTPQRMLGVAIDVTPQREQEVLLQKLAHFDALTGLPNRVLLARNLQEAMTRARQHGTLLGVAYLDLDGFKPVNDRFGHGAGDRLLMAVAGRLSRALRSDDCVARLGGDEFVLLLPGLESRADCETRLHRVMESVAAPYPLDSECVVVTASIGYTLFPSDDADADTLLRHADQAMYAAKQAGRNRFHLFDAVQDRAVQLLREQAQRMRNALDEEQFTLYLQPKVDMRMGTVVGAEALVRWRHPERGVLAPGEFLPLIEGTELEIVFGQWVIEAALHKLEKLQGLGMELPMSINVGAQQLQQNDFATWVAQCLQRHPGVPGHMVEIEITESAALYDLHAVTGTLESLRALGVAVSLDDFGTGYSSLTYLRRLPMDTLKIDQSFVHGMMNDPGDLAIVQGVIGLARSFGYRVIAEGVETIEQGQMLLQLGCPQAQGYCIGKPMPLVDFVEWTRTWQPPAGWHRNRPV